MRKLTLEQAALEYAWTLGHDDYPVSGRCPYHPIKSAVLHDAYWAGWCAASEEGARTFDHAAMPAA